MKVITDTKAFSEIDWNDQSSLDKCFMECDILSLQEQMEEMAFLGLAQKKVSDCRHFMNALANHLMKYMGK